MVINKKTSKIYKHCVFTGYFLSLKFVGIVYISSSYDFITSSQILAESSIILAKYFSFSQLHVTGFQT